VTDQPPLSRTTIVPPPALAGELESLVSVQTAGQLTDSEFAAAKSRLLVS
jgi:hypothetical protein